MSDAVIVVERVSKAYRLYAKPEDRLKHSLLWRFGRFYGTDFWALHETSFSIPPGQSVGIIGRNGSGKSTLLQVITGTLQPTTGHVVVNGRVAALFELGSGFNQEYTGRENVYLNGAILGMSRQEMDSCLDRILAFADIGQFIDQPVKFYSSGMVVRLAFAVQAMVRKDVLIVDEALAVGDEAFQRKCMRQLEQFREDGGTVLLVSHSADAIVRQCSRCLFMHEGRMVLDGPSKPVTDIYQRFLYGTQAEKDQTLAILNSAKDRDVEDILGMLNPQSEPADSTPTRNKSGPAMDIDYTLERTSELVYGNGAAEILNCRMTDRSDRDINVLITGQTCVWSFEALFHENVTKANFGMSLRTVDGLLVSGINTEWLHMEFPPYKPGDRVAVRFTLQLNLGAGVYFTEAGIVGESPIPVGPGGFLHRRVDISAIRVVSPVNERVVGVSYLRPEVKLRRLETTVAPPR